jgi:dihydropyrimidinase
MPLVHAENGDVVAQLQQKLMAEGNNGPEAHAYSRPAEVEGEATNRAIMIADMAGTPLYIVHTSCEQAHEAIRRARQKGMRVYGEPLIQHLTLDESEYAHPDWDHAARRVMSPPFRNKMHQDSLWAGLSGRLAAGGRHRPLRLHHRAEALWRWRFHQDPQRHRRSGGPHADAVDLWRGDRPADDERVRRRHLDQHRQDPQHVPEKGRGAGRRRCRSLVWDPEKSKTITADTQQSAIDYNVFEGKQVKGLPRYTLTRGHVAVHDGEIRTQEGHGKFVAREPVTPVNKALSSWKELTSPRKVERSGIPATGV